MEVGGGDVNRKNGGVGREVEARKCVHVGEWEKLDVFFVASENNFDYFFSINSFDFVLQQRRNQSNGV